jgi:hypothetical protein
MPHSPEPMRHIPEDELHAYLDQALSRSQCVEIEHHLSDCRTCQAHRDAIAALRDRTTALLVTASPRRIRPRPFAHLSAAHFDRSTHRDRRLRGVVWAASLLAAIGLGWALHKGATPDTALLTAERPGEPVIAPPLMAAAPRQRPPEARDAAPRRPTTRLATASPTQAPTDAPHLPAGDSGAEHPEAPFVPPRPVGSELASLGTSASAGEPVLSGVWRTVPLNTPQADQGDWVPRVDGMPVVQVKVRQAPQGGRPITLVTQRLANGEMISTVEGPAPEVAALLSEQPGSSASADIQDMQAPMRSVDSTEGRPAGRAAPPPRTLAIFGSASADSLKALMLRVK